ncbi:MAG: hypothetical protein F4Y82_02260 [Cenarchaeum sp. SB0665_bin_23]|nr:hypothetical protein [Cenarchaeum sp. SB0667_bin_13]MXY38111.1 hypothetical protein [Cenarchaeum sp. SB0664_bin_35]MXY60925.1 hypothetical protein [Cenarchaeum sp. SB0665_bin_23]MXZ94049.1 hypothetical protein [Cenarchaeum sp. SB0666_bin_15]MYB46898.1 hypothetical protein [Cenarchaeum sp. SB0662_bin_33]MYC79601.1 hypothetical protein [Cenarchaeum sp. SB0661_bin_35]MYD59087.1 hypothetical protein [Cenarchaeum sp. SB0678_bin_8]MYG32857.1 hypothetical protein [Cenarchaeum sp. SB0677_bin_16]
MKNDQSQDKTKDVFTTYQDMVDKVFTNINQTVPKYYQFITDAQQEVFKTLEENVTSAIKLQKEMATKGGLPTSAPDSNLRLMKDSTESYIKLATIGNQLVLAAVAAAQQTVKTGNENVKAITDLSQDVTRSWMTAFAIPN